RGLVRLHSRCVTTTLSALSEPPFAIGTTWSIWRSSGTTGPLHQKHIDLSRSMIWDLTHRGDVGSVWASMRALRRNAALRLTSFPLSDLKYAKRSSRCAS